MKSYRFTIYLRGVDYMTEDMAEALYASGCDDCLPGSSDGQCHAAFDREAASLEVAVASAVDNIRAAGLHVDRVQIDADGLTMLNAAAS
ncbi:MAG: hypothetical protein WD070_07260 [Pirellulaceae bacterium]